MMINSNAPNIIITIIITLFYTSQDPLNSSSPTSSFCIMHYKVTIVCFRGHFGHISNDYPMMVLVKFLLLMWHPWNGFVYTSSIDMHWLLSEWNRSYLFPEDMLVWVTSAVLKNSRWNSEICVTYIKSQENHHDGYCVVL